MLVYINTQNDVHKNGYKHKLILLTHTLLIHNIEKHTHLKDTLA